MSTVMSTLAVLSALAAAGPPAHVARSDTHFAAKAALEVVQTPPVQKIVWSEQDQRRFFDELGDRGG